MLSYHAYFSEIVFSFKDKNIHWPTFVSSFSAVYRVSIPGGYPRRSILLFQASRHGQFLHTTFVRDVTETVGRWIIVNHKQDDYASTALTFVNVSNTTRLLGGEKEKEILIFVYMFFKRKNTRAISFYHCFSILRSRKCGNIYIRLHTFHVRINAELKIHTFAHLYGGEKTGMLKIFFSFSVYPP